MNTRTRRMLLNMATGLAILTTAALVLMPAATSAAPATATAAVNVRTGPGTGYAIVDTLFRGESVDVQQCRGTWCYVLKDGPDGWVSASYLGGIRVQPGVRFGFSIGGDGPRFSFGIGTPPPVIDDEIGIGNVCFYERTLYRGDRFCVNEGTAIRNLREWGDRISSIRNPDGLRVTVCLERGYSDCRIYTTSARSLGGFDDDISSLRVR